MKILRLNLMMALVVLFLFACEEQNEIQPDIQSPGITEIDENVTSSFVIPQGEIIASPDYFFFAQGFMTGGTATITAPGDWTVIYDAYWLNVYPTSGTGNGYISISVKPEYVNSPIFIGRTASIRVKLLDPNIFSQDEIINVSYNVNGAPEFHGEI